METDPTREWSYVLLVDSLINLKKTGQAKTWLEKGLVLFPDSEGLNELRSLL